MGTNFYWKISDGQTPMGATVPTSYSDMDPLVHLGKRSAAGRFCWDCRVPLFAGGMQDIHSDHAVPLNACPRCGATAAPQAYNAALVELGIASTPEPPTQLRGVQGASSFSWAQDPDAAIATCTAHLFEVIIVDEYDTAYTGQEFLWMLESACPIRFTHSIGHEFC